LLRDRTAALNYFSGLDIGDKRPEGCLKIDAFVGKKISVFRSDQGFNKDFRDFRKMDVFSMGFFKKDPNWSFPVIIIDRAFRGNDSVNGTSLYPGRGIECYFVEHKANQNQRNKEKQAR